MVVVGTNEQVPLPRSQPACVCGRKNLISESQDLLLGCVML
uniref:ST8 alpha-N-acetyl-neuraminide alpha-2,8-sialyltransferase 5 n=1 Tax=Homo sapiens TaxID=9606 RepID=K7EN49_HUMAN